MIEEKFQLTDKVALVVGGRGFLGNQFSAALAEFGAHVYTADLAELSPAVKKSGDHVPQSGMTHKTVDVTDEKSVKTLVQNITAEKPHIDVLVYSVTARPQDSYKSFTDCSLEGFRIVLRAELEGLFLVTQQVGRIMEAQGYGSIIFISSIYGMVGNDQRIYEGANLADLYASKGGNKVGGKIYSPIAYAAAKGAVISMTRFLAAYWQGTRIRVNCVSPGGISHPGENEEFVRRYSERVPLRRKADVDEVSGAVVYLASNASSYVTGQNLVVDGGWTAW